MDNEARNISDFIQMREWKHALFTTYTLSLSYFESEILPSLIRAGCTDIWLIADAEGYRSSLLERRSMRVGHEYRLIPAALPNGVFHAKSVYLSGDEGDLLLIGSGNVTFAGHGRNLEVFEALVPETDGVAFADFANYLEAMRERSDISFARTDWIDEFAVRAMLASSEQSGSNRLLHSLTEPIIDQIPAALDRYDPCASATVMSPYHDLDGRAVHRLSQALGDIPISISIGQENKTPFPFDVASSWSIPSRPVRPSSKDMRFAHAKLYEFFCGDRYVLLTGSINATRKALTTTDNVELGVLRELPAGENFMQWQLAEAPTFEAQTRMPSGLRGNEIVYATFDRDEPERLSGKIISLQPVRGLWSALIIQADGDTISFEVAANDDGQFSHTSKDFGSFSEMSALQIILTRDKREARGWIHNEMFLSMSGRRRLTAGSLSRLMRREGSDDDVEALLDYLSMHADNHLRIFDVPVRTANAEEDNQMAKPEIVSVNLDELAPVESVSNERINEDGNGERQIDAFDLAMQRLRKVFLGHGRSSTTVVSAFSESIVAEEDVGENGSGNEPQKLEREKRSLAVFETQMNQLIDEAKDSPTSIRALFALKLEVGMWMRIYRLNDLDDAHEFLKSWFYQACRLVELESGKLSSVEQHIVTNATIIFALAHENNRVKIALAIHDGLEHLYRGDVDQDHLLSARVPHNDIGFAAILLGDKSTEEAFDDALLEIVAHPTSRQQLIQALDLAQRGEMIPKEWGVFQSKLGLDLYKALQHPKWSKKVRAIDRKSTACAFDYFSFSKDVAAKFRQFRIGQCIHCKRFTLDISP